MDVKRPIQLGDTIYVNCEVTESRATSKPGRGLVRTRNCEVNQNDQEVLVYRPLRLYKSLQALS